MRKFSADQFRFSNPFQCKFLIDPNSLIYQSSEGISKPSKDIHMKFWSFFWMINQFVLVEGVRGDFFLSPLTCSLPLTFPFLELLPASTYFCDNPPFAYHAWYFISHTVHFAIAFLVATYHALTREAFAFAYSASVNGYFFCKIVSCF